MTATKKKKAVVELDGKSLKIFNRELISFYLKNYKEISIVGEDLLERLNEIKVYMSKLSSLEIVELSNEKIILRDLTHLRELNLRSLLFEIIEMEKKVFDKLRSPEEKNSRYQIVTQFDAHINKLTFLCYKAINYNLELQERHEEIKNEIYYWRIVSAFENIGDILKRTARYLKEETNKEHIILDSLLQQLCEYYKFVTNLLHTGIELNVNLKLAQDKKQSLLREFEASRDQFGENLNLYLVLTQLFKDLLGQLEDVVVSLIDLHLK